MRRYLAQRAGIASHDRGESHILTTHTGSLPRPEGLVAMLGAVSRGEQVDETALAEAAWTPQTQGAIMSFLPRLAIGHDRLSLSFRG